MSKQAQILCAWCGIASVAVFFIGFWPLAHFMPPIQPSWNAEKIASLYRDNTMGLRLGAIMILFSGSLLVPFYVAVSMQLKRMEGGFGAMSLSQFALGTLSVTPFLPAAVLMAVATFRIERSDAEILLLNDTVWLLLLMIAPPLMLEYLAIGYAVLKDRSPLPILPRWFGYFTIWDALMNIPSLVIVFFKTGPFAWSGVFGFWIPASLFGTWTIMMSVLLIVAIRKQEND